MKPVLSALFLCFFLAACQTTPYQPSSGRKPPPKKAVLMIEEPDKTSQVRAYIHDSGKIDRNQPFQVRGVNGSILCNGTYSINSLYEKGFLSLSCFDGKMGGVGSFQNHGIRNKRSYGIGEIQSGRTKIRVIFGVTDAEFMRAAES